MCSHFFHSTIGRILGDVVGAAAGAFLGPEVLGISAGLGGAIGGGLAGAGGSALGGGNLGQDILGGALGAAGGYGIGSGLQALDLVPAADAASTASALGVTPDPGVAPALQPSPLQGEIAAPTAVSEAGAEGGGPSALSIGQATPGQIATDLASQQALVPPGESIASTALTGQDTTGLPDWAAQALRPIGPDNPIVTGDSAANTLSNLRGQVFGFPQSDLTDASGNYILPPTMVPEYGTTPVVDPASGSIVNPGSQGYDAAYAARSAQPTMAAPATAQQGATSSFFNSTPVQAAGLAASGLGLLRAIGQSNQANPIPGMGQLQQIAQQSQTQGQILQNYLTTGTLPPAVQASVDQATQDGITSIKNKYASMGIAPNSTQEAQDIARLQQNAVVQGATLADQLSQQGLSMTTLSGQLYNELVGYNQTLNTQTGQAISNLAQALSGTGNTFTVNSQGQLVRAA